MCNLKSYFHIVLIVKIVCIMKHSPLTVIGEASDMDRISHREILSQ